MDYISKHGKVYGAWVTAPSEGEYSRFTLFESTHDLTNVKIINNFVDGVNNRGGSNA